MVIPPLSYFAVLIWPPFFPLYFISIDIPVILRLHQFHESQKSNVSVGPLFLRSGGVEYCGVRLSCRQLSCGSDTGLLIGTKLHVMLSSK
jgi:hypothetical protein